MGKRLLVATSDSLLSSDLARRFSGSEWIIDVSESGPRALSTVACDAYDVVVADLEVKDAVDVDLVRRIGRLRPGTKVIVVSEAGKTSEIVEAIKRHAFAYFSRPLDLDALTEMAMRAAEATEWTDGIEVRSASPAWIELAVRCRTITADRLAQFMRELKLDIPEAEHLDIVTAFREMLMNAMEHGCDFDPDQIVEVSYVRTSRALIYSISDPGAGFSFDKLPHAAVSNPEGSPAEHMSYRMERGMRAGGFGISVTRQLVDELIYNELGNKVLLIKYLKTSVQH